MSRPDATSWEIWYTDSFDRDADPAREATGTGRVAGLETLWRKTLDETVQDDGKITFTHFTLWQDGRRGPAIPVDPLSNAELGKLRPLILRVKACREPGRPRRAARGAGAAPARRSVTRARRGRRRRLD